MRAAQTTIVIQAPLQQVWEVMTNVQDYPNWNPFIKKVITHTSPPCKGTHLTFEVQFENGRQARSQELVTEWRPPVPTGEQQAHWAYRFYGWLDRLRCIQAVRLQSLQAQSNGSTRYTTREIFRGWGIALVPLAQVQKGFEAQAAALKKVCEE